MLSVAFFFLLFISNCFGQQDFDYWKSETDERIRIKINSLHQIFNNMKSKPVKNVILFIGDGMGATVLTGARIYRSQKEPNVTYQEPFEFEKFPFSGLSKTHSFDSHVVDSAAGATALLCGVKTINDLVAMNPHVPLGHLSQVANGSVECIANLALKAGKSVGLVTTTRVTHATPATLYAHSANRRWESDADMIKLGAAASEYKDIARQMVEDFPANEFTVILGAGWSKFKPNCTSDQHSERRDGRNLIQDWLLKNKNSSRTFVNTLNDLKSIDYENTDQLLGLFAPDHLNYVADTKDGVQPTLADMSRVAVELLKKNDKGGRIDQALHENQAKRSFEEVIALDEAVRTVMETSKLSDTLIIVTADHSHNLNIIGFPPKTTSILGLVYPNDSRIIIDDKKPSTILTFADGKSAAGSEALRDYLNVTDTESNSFRQLSMIPRPKASHGGEDVPVYAIGPYSYLFGRLMENTEIAHYMIAASCIGSDHKMCVELTGGETGRAISLRDLNMNNYLGTVLTFLLSVALFVSLFINVLLACKTRY